MSDCSCDCVPIAGQDRCTPQFGAIVSLPLGADDAGSNGTGTRTEQSLTHETAEYDWSSLIPGLTGRASFVTNAPGGAGGFTAGGIGMGTGAAANCNFVAIQFDKPVQIRRLFLNDFDGPTYELAWSFDPPLDAVSGNFRNNQCTNNAGGCRFPQIQETNRGCVRSIAQNQSGFVFWNAPLVTGVQWGISLPAALGAGFATLDAQAELPPLKAHPERCADGTIRWVNNITGAVLTPAQVNALQECD